MNHAKEPWKVDSPIGAAHPEIKDVDGRRVAVIAGTYPMGPKQDDANAARIVACVIACAGMEDPEQEIMLLRQSVRYEGDVAADAVDEVHKQRAEIAILKAQLDELLRGKV